MGSIGVLREVNSQTSQKIRFDGKLFEFLK